MTPPLAVTVLIAGAAGALLRYGVSLVFLRRTDFPRAVLLVNVIGSIIGGTVYGLAERGGLGADLKLVLLTGLAGGLTTFSTWSVETIQLLESGRWRTAIANVVINLMLGLAAAFASYAVVVFFVQLTAYRP